MRFHALSIGLGIAALGVGIFPVPITTASPKPNASILAQRVPIGTVGHVSPDGAVRLVILNNTPVALYGVLSGGARVELLPEGRNIFVFDSTPIHMFVYPVRRGSSLKFDTTVRANIVTVQVTQVDSDNSGDGAISIKPSGDIYVY